MTTQWDFQYKNPIYDILKEDGFYLLLENGYKIVLEQTGSDTNMWTDQNKN